MQTLSDLKETFTKLTSTLTIHEKEKLPAQPQSNPKGHQNYSECSQHLDQVKSVITLRNGKVIEKHLFEPQEVENKLASEG